MGPPSGSTTARILASLTLLALTILSLPACTSSKAPSEARTSGPTPSISVAPGSLVYRYTNTGLTATMVLQGKTGTLQIDNRSGHEVGEPGFYVLGAVDGRRVDGTVTDAAVVPDGADRTFDVTLGNVEPKDIGLLVLMMGADNYGAFVEQQGSG